MTRFKVTRQFFIPKEAEEIRDEEANAVAYLSMSNGKPWAMGFGGRRQKPDFNYTFQTEQLARAYIQKHFDHQRRLVKAKEARKGFKTSLEIGDILYTSWGYEQTNIDWYQVVEVKPSGKTVVIREICGETVEDGAAMYSGYTMPLKNCFTKDSQPITKRVREGNVLSMTSYSSAFPWDGKRKYWSSYH